MPVIPGADEGQILNAGSPVPISSPEETRMMGQALAGVGRGMFDLGNAMDQAAQKEKAKRDIISEQLALEKLRQEQLKEFAARVAAAPVEDDPTGFKQVELFNENMRERLNSIAEAIPDDNVRRGFMARAGDSINDTAKELYAKEIVKRAKSNELLQGKLIAEMGKTAQLSPGDMPELFAKAELSIVNNLDIPEAEKAIRISEAQKQILLDGVNGRLNSREYEQASVLADKFGNILEPVEKQKLMDTISEKQYKDYNRELLEITRTEKRAEMYLKQVQDKTVSGYLSALKEAGNNDLKRAPIIDQMQLDVLKGNLKNEAFQQLSGLKTFSRPLDDKYEGDIMSEVFKTDNYAGAIDKVTADRNNGKVSYERSADIITRLNALEERKRNDPKFTQLVEEGRRLIEVQKEPSILDGIDSTLEKQKHLTKVAIAIQDYRVALTKNPKLDPVRLSREIVKNRFDADIKFLNRKERYLEYRSPEGVDAARDRIIKESFGLKKKGQLTKEKEIQYKKELKILEEKKIRLLEDQKYQETVRGKNEAPVRGR